MKQTGLPRILQRCVKTYRGLLVCDWGLRQVRVTIAGIVGHDAHAAEDVSAQCEFDGRTAGHGLLHWCCGGGGGGLLVGWRRRKFEIADAAVDDLVAVVVEIGGRGGDDIRREVVGHAPGEVVFVVHFSV